MTSSAGFGLGCLTGWIGLGGSKTFLTGTGLGCLTGWTGLGGSKTCLTGTGLGCLTGSVGFGLGCLTSCAAGEGLTCLALPKNVLGGSCLAVDITEGGLAGSCLTDDTTIGLGGSCFATCMGDLGVYCLTSDTAGGLGGSDFASSTTGGCFGVPCGLGGSCFTVEGCVGRTLLWFDNAVTTAGLEVGSLAAEVLVCVGGRGEENGALATGAEGGWEGFVGTEEGEEEGGCLVLAGVPNDKLGSGGAAPPTVEVAVFEAV